MIFALVFIFTFVGMILCGIIGLMPLEAQYMIPDVFRVMMFMFGIMVSFIGLIIMHSRAQKTGAIHLLEFGKPGIINWFYIHKDGTIKITPGIREVEGQLYSPSLDAQIRELKSYRIFDHSIRIVPEGIGHAVDLDMVLYANLLRTKYGFASLKDARRGVFDFLKQKEPVAREQIFSPEEEV